MFELSETQLPHTESGIVDLAPVAAEPAGWILLAGDGTLKHVDANSGVTRDVARIEIPAEPASVPWNNQPLTPRLQLSGCGTFAAIVNDYGRLGALYELLTGRRTLSIDGGDYHSETVPLSFAFVEHDGRAVAVHRTAWNRLDASDAATGEFLTAREIIPYRRGQPLPAHYLNYFHGRLMVSPDGRCILDDGWAWHPVGFPRVWTIEAWLSTNVWESEDGSSLIDFVGRENWNHALCWLDSARLIVGGLGDEGFPEKEDRVRIFSAGISRHTLAEFTAPVGTYFSDGQLLFIANDEGLSVWDPETGANTGSIEGFHPTQQHSAGRELVEVAGSVLRRWHY